MQPTIEIVPLTDAQPDSRNANQGTQRGKEMLRTSLSKFGAGRSILLDKNLKIIAGNKTQENAVEMGIEEMIVVHTTGDKLVAVVRDDLDINEQSGREMAYADNRIAEIDLSFNIEILREDMRNDIDLSDWWNANEIAGINRGIAAGDVNRTGEWGGMPEFENNAQDYYRTLIVHFDSEESVQDFKKRIEQDFSIAAKYICHPKQIIKSETDFVYVDAT